MASRKIRDEEQDLDHEDLRAELLDWFELFASCVRDRDFAAGKRLFDSKVIAFGTRNEMMKGLDALHEMQWRPTWNSTRDFRFLRETIHIDIAASGDVAWGSGLWTSRAEPEGGPGFDRSGRATFCFSRRQGWRCTHSHLSLSPSGSL